ncbi:acylneuraminate cytidylyltransferase family protein [Patescibacteria group bacterium]|nr:acylneuraminate cytidylyltransferase family protein [Patescibacteria group bacterium]
MKKIVAIIPVKGNSTRIPNKNIKNLAGKPMMAYIIESTLKVKSVDRVVVTTESKELAEIAKKYGADVPFLRPASLCADHTTSLEVIQHTLKELEEKEGYVADYALLVYATSPLLKSERIEQAINIALEKDSDSVFSGTYDKGHYWKEIKGKWKRLYPIELLCSQFQEPLVKENGAIYLSKTSVLEKQLLADKADVLIMEKGENIDVDYPEDFAKVEKILSSK